MTYAPGRLKELAAYYVAQGGVNLGIVGDASHTSKGTSYHLGKDDLIAGAYSARLPRDLAGLTNAASAIDLGRLDGTLTKLWAFSRWFAGRCSAGDPAYRDVREVIFWSTARGRVLGWSSEAPGDGWVNDYGDLSHKTHTHISYFRDSEQRDKVAMFAPYFKTTEAVMPVFKTLSVPKYVTVPDKDWLYVKPDLSVDPGNVQISPGPRDMPVAGKLSDGTLIIGYVDATPTEAELPTYYVRGYTLKAYAAPVPPPADCTDAIQTATVAERIRISQAEAERIRSI